MKVTFGEYSAFTTKNNLVRYQKDGKLISESVLPKEVVAYLNKELKKNIEPRYDEIATQRFPMPTEAEKARLREESLKVKPELQREEAEIQSYEAQAEQAVADFDGSFNPEPLEITDEVIEAVMEDDNADFLEQVSIHTASIQDIATALYERFGVYTVYLDRPPASDEVNPLTGEIFTKYHLGIAYQAAVYAKNKGVLRNPEQLKKRIDSSREYSKTWQVDQAPRTMAEARQANSFDYRTSVGATRPDVTTEIVHITDPDGTVRAVQREIPKGQTGEFNGAQGRYDHESDQVLVEPQFGKQVIRPNW